MVWWLWAILGLVLAALELGTPGGFYLLFFGIGALAVALLTAAGAIHATLPQLLWFSTLSVCASLLFRRRLVEMLTPQIPAAALNSLVGETASALEDIGPGAFGKVELRGTAWNARNGGEAKVTRGQRCVVERVEGLSLWITPASQ
ncbi:MAG: NfeD family protein [Deltaproteobacteria bacterium]|nr:NfeD family protein [Deltaproteobacteria bacterium]